MKRKITTAALMALLLSVKGAKIVSIVAQTSPKLKKRGNPFADQDVTKTSTLNAILNFNYRNALAKKLKVKDPQRIAVYNGALYLEAKLNGKPKKVTYRAENGDVIPTKKLAAWIPEHKEQDVPMCDIKLQNIKELKLNGVRYIVN